MNPVLASDPTIPDFLSPMHIYVLEFPELRGIIRPDMPTVLIPANRENLPRFLLVQLLLLLPFAGSQVTVSPYEICD
jgi:hypothetical protein